MPLADLEKKSKNFISGVNLDRVVDVVAGSSGKLYALDRKGDRALVFDKELNCREWMVTDLKSVFHQQLMQPKSGYLWNIGYLKMSLLGENGRVLKNIERRPDDFWLGELSLPSVAQNGSLAIQSRNSGRWICVLDDRGDYISCFRIPWHYAELVSFDGELVYIRCEDEIYIYSKKGTPLGGVFIPEDSFSYFGPFITDIPKRLAFVGKDGSTITYYDVKIQNFH